MLEHYGRDPFGESEAAQAQCVIDQVRDDIAEVLNNTVDEEDLDCQRELPTSYVAQALDRLAKCGVVDLNSDSYELYRRLEELRDLPNSMLSATVRD